MELVNTLQASEPLDQDVRPEILKETLELLVLMLSAHGCRTFPKSCGRCLGTPRGSMARRGRNLVPQLAEEEQVEIVIQINGRVRGKMRVDSGSGRTGTAGTGAHGTRGLSRSCAATPILKRVVVPNRLVNLVIS